MTLPLSHPVDPHLIASSSVEISRGLTPISTTGKTYYVSGTGNDANRGLDPKAAFRTLQKAANLVQAGDTVYVMNGTYERTDSQREIMTLFEKRGRPDAWISFKAYPGAKPIVRSQNSYAVNILGSSYVAIEGLTFEGAYDRLTLAAARQRQGNMEDPIASNNGIGVQPSWRNGKISRYADHIVIRDNTISKFGSAISVGKSDYVTVENNRVFDNCWYSANGQNAISFLYNRNSDDNTKDYKMVIRGNIVYNNVSFIPWKQTGKISEGNGIMIDDALNTQKASNREPYRGRTLVENNIVYRNGAAGIQVYSSANVDVINNTAYRNAQNAATPYGEIIAIASDRVHVFNNILYSNPGAKLNSSFKSTRNIRYDHNLAFNSTKFENLGSNNLLGKDPRFVDPDRGNFALRSDSPAIDIGVTQGAPRRDQQNHRRENGIDLGALEWSTARRK
jgi:parallel beta-helix repeat protein